MAGATWILANGQPFLTVRDEDAALEAVDRQILAEAYQARIANAIAAYRTARQPAILWRNAFLTVAATLLLLAAAFICRRVVGYCTDASSAAIGTRLETSGSCRSRC